MIYHFADSNCTNMKLQSDKIVHKQKIRQKKTIRAYAILLT